MEDIRKDPNCACIGVCRLSKTRGRYACEKIRMNKTQRKIAVYHPYNKWALKGQDEYYERIRRDAPEEMICTGCGDTFKPDTLEDVMCEDCEDSEA